MKCKLKKNGKVYTIVFDDEGVLDTVECDGKFLTTKNAVCKSILSNYLSIRAGRIPKGFEKA